MLKAEEQLKNVEELICQGIEEKGDKNNCTCWSFKEICKEKIANSLTSKLHL